VERQKAVVDASVVAKWFLEERHSEEARVLRDSFAKGMLSLAVPGLMFYETLNVLRYAGLYTEDELAEGARALTEYGFEVWAPSGKLLEETASMSLRYDITVYDASYVALAMHLDIPLYSADMELVKKELARHFTSLRQ
jgi:predicted nucleic acid-binding protein